VTSEVGICNGALTKVGEETIISLGEDSKAARLCNLMFDRLRDSILRAHPWNFAIKRVELAELTTTPIFGFASQFQLPTDCLRVLRTDEDQIPHQIEGRILLTDAGTVQIKYIAQITDPNLFDSLFIQALEDRIGAELAYNLSDNRALSVDMRAKYKETLKEARAMDGQEGVSDIVEADEWLNIRL
jgi:hypothetical protein